MTLRRPFNADDLRAAAKTLRDATPAQRRLWGTEWEG